MNDRLGITGRLLIVAGLIIVVQLVAHQVRAHLEPAAIALPDWSLTELPMQLGDWRGEQAELDERVFRKIGADQAEDWIYALPDGRTASAHIAVFEDLDEGVWHYPANCYGAAGWAGLDSSDEQLTVEDLPPREVNVSTWKREGQVVKVLYWYQLGEHTIFGRYDLGKARLALAGRETWPPLVKVLLQTSADDEPVEAELALKDLGGRIHAWLYARGIGGGDGIPVSAEEAAEIADTAVQTGADPMAGAEPAPKALPGEANGPLDEVLPDEAALPAPGDQGPTEEPAPTP